MKKTAERFVNNFGAIFSLVLALASVLILAMSSSTPKELKTIDTTHTNLNSNLKTYYYVGDGKDERMLTGWINIDNQWHFFDRKTGEMVTNSWMHDESRDGECFFDENGAMQLGWVIIDGEQYYFSFEEEDYGNAVTGTRVIDGKEFRFDDNGVLQKT